MVNSLKNNLEKTDNLNQLLELIKNLKTKEIGFFGGRKFILEETEGELALNDIIRKFDDLCDKISDNEEVAVQIRRGIHELDEAANEKLNKKNFFTRLMSAIRSTFGSYPASSKHQAMKNRPREEVLLLLAGYFKQDSPCQRQYLAEEVFDEISGKVEKAVNGVNIEQLKQAIVQSVDTKQAEIAQENKQLLAVAVKAFLQRSRPTSSQDDFFVRNLIYWYRHIGDDSLINTQLPALLIAAYADAYNYKNSNFSAPTHPMNNFAVLITTETYWNLKRDYDLIQKAEKEYQAMLSQKS